MTHLDWIELNEALSFTVTIFEVRPSDTQHLGGSAFFVSIARLNVLRDDNYQAKWNVSRQKLQPPTV